MLIRFALTLAMAGLATAQTHDRTFFLSHPASNAELTNLVAMVRTIVNAQAIVPDQAQNAIVASNLTVDQSMATEYLIQQLDQPATDKTGFRLAGDDGELIRVFRLAPTATTQDLTGMVTAVRTLVDIQRVLPFIPEKTIVARASSIKMAALEWVIQEVEKPATDSVTKSSDYVLTDQRPGPETIKVIHMRKGTSNSNLAGMVTAIRTVADVGRLFPLESSAAVLMRDEAGKVAAAEWLIDELTTQPDPTGTHETKLPGVTDGVVHVFYLNHRKSTDDLKNLIAQLRTGAQLQRLFPYEFSSAVVLRGRADQVSLATSLVAKFDAEEK